VIIVNITIHVQLMIEF